MQQRDHHDWTSDMYVEEWIQRQQVADPVRAEWTRWSSERLRRPHTHRSRPSLPTSTST